MFQNILVPLDGSARAEQAIPVAARLARSSSGTLILLHSASLHIEYGPSLVLAPAARKSILETEMAGAKRYLDRVSLRDDLAGIKVLTEVLASRVVQTILSATRDHHVDLIVLCSHGYTGIKRWALGSVAQQLARQSPVPVLVLREDNPESMERLADDLHPYRVVVGLDGSPFAQAAIAPTAHLVAALTPPHLQGTLHLTQVLKLSPLMEELEDQQWGLDINLQDQALQEARTSLQAVADETTNTLGAALAVRIIWSVEEGQDVADELINVAELGDTIDAREAYDVIALTTHGRGGFQRWTAGSVTEDVFDGTKLPLLIVRLTWLMDSAARRYPSHTAFSYYGTNISYAHFSHYATRFAIELHRLGVKKGDRVAISLPNIPQYPIAFYGALKMGAVVVPTNPLYTEREVQSRLTDSGARVMVVLDALYPIVRAIRNQTGL